MIPSPFLDEWRFAAPWADDEMVEQDLIISRLLVELFTRPEIYNSFAFRGGTAIYKLFVPEPIRYSESIGNHLEIIKNIIDPILGKPKYKQSKKVTTLTYSFISESKKQKKPLKIEINTREHFTLYGWEQRKLNVQSRWFSGNADILTYQLDELIGTKLRAFYQRDKGRDLFDLWFVLKQSGFEPTRAVEAFLYYIEKEEKVITRKMFETNIFEKQESGSFSQDISPLLSPKIKWNFEEAASEVFNIFLPLIPEKKQKFKER